MLYYRYSYFSEVSQIVCTQRIAHRVLLVLVSSFHTRTQAYGIEHVGDVVLVAPSRLELERGAPPAEVDVLIDTGMTIVHVLGQSTSQGMSRDVDVELVLGSLPVLPFHVPEHVVRFTEPLVVPRLPYQDVDVAPEILETCTAIVQSGTPVPHDDAVGLRIEEHGVFLSTEFPVQVIPLALELVEHLLSFF